MRGAPALVLLPLVLIMPPAFAAARTIDIEVGTYPNGRMYLTPGNVTVDVGSTVTFRVKNVDEIFHDVRVILADKDVEIEVAARSTEEATFDVPDAGDFRMICEVRGHKQLGMQGTLHVVDARESPEGGGVVAMLALSLVAIAMRRRR